jgi:signal transduction histidine kinase
MEGEPPIADLRPGESTRVPETPIEDDEFLLVAVEAETDDGTMTVIVGRTLETVEDARATLTGLLRFGAPAVIAIVALITWWVVGRALAPVEAVRSEAAAISAEALHRRVPVPPTHDEIARLGVTLNEMLDRLERAQVRQQRFVADASHELRSPIASIRQHAEVAQSHPDSTTVTELAGAILDEERRVEQLVDQMLTLARADERIALQRRMVDLDDIVFDEVERARTRSTVTVDATKVSAGQVAGDPGQLRHAVRNLLDNALRHARSTVAVTLQEHDSLVELSVDDDGPGIPEQERERVFERFVRLDDARSRDRGGAGLGLSIVAAIAVAHAGTVTATSSPLGGARLQVVLPAAIDG